MIIIAFHLKGIKISNNMSKYLKQFFSLCSNNRVSPGIHLTPLVYEYFDTLRYFFVINVVNERTHKTVLKQAEMH